MIPDNVLDPPKKSSTDLLRIGIIQTITAEGASIKFEGEDTASDKIYKVLTSYYPVLNDRVALYKKNGTYFILGAIGVPQTATEYIPASEKAQPNGVATLNADSKLVQTALNSDNASSASYASSAHYADYLDSHGSITSLSSQAQLSDVISKVNTIITIMKNSGMAD